MRFQLDAIFLHLLPFLLICNFPLTSRAAVNLPAVIGYFVEEFYSGDGDLSNKENLADQWTKSALVNSHFSTTNECNGWFMLGGVGILRTNGYFRRIYSGIPTHNIVYYMIYLIIIDDWKATDSIKIQFQNDPVQTWLPLAAKDDLGRDLCGNMVGTNNRDVHFRIIGKYLHSGGSLALRLTSGVTGYTTAGWGINYVQMSFHTDTTGQTTENCTTYDGGNGVYGTTCTCSVNEYEDPVGSGTCVACDPSCYHCFAATNAGCYVCNTGFVWDGNQCTTVTCPAGCERCNPTNNRCSVCDNTHAMRWDYACIDPATCNAPYQIDLAGTYQFCRTPCQDNSTFMFWNGNCTTNCDFPLKTRSVGQAKFCDYGCTTASDYLYINGTCVDQCDYFTREEDGNKFCDPCLPLGNYLNWLGICMDTCPFPMPSRNEGGYLRCDNPCSKEGDYYYPRYGMCKTGCEYPFKIIYYGICILDLTEEEEQSLNRMEDARKGLGYFLNSGTIIVAATNFLSPTASFAFALTKILEYIRYMNVRYPPQLIYIFELQSAFGGLFWFLPCILEEKFVRYTLPDNFEYYEVHSKFFINIGPDLLAMLGILFITLIILIIFSLLPKETKIYTVFEKMKNSLKWNCFLSIFCTFYANIILATSLEVRTLHLNDFYSILSFVICCLMNLLGIFLLFKILLVLKGVWSMKTPASQTPRNHNNSQQLPGMVQTRWGDFEVAYGSYKSNSKYRIVFMPIFILTQYFFSSMIAFVFDYPMVQATFICGMNLAMLVYIILKNPFKGLMDLFEILIQEVMTATICGCVLTLAIFDEGKIEAYDQRSTLGDIIIVCSFISIGTAIIYLIYHLMIAMAEAYKLIRTHLVPKFKKKVAPITETPQVWRTNTEPINISNLSQMEFFPSPPVPEGEGDQIRDMFKPKGDIFEEQATIVTASSGLVKIPRLRLDSLEEYVRPLDMSSQLNSHFNGSGIDLSLSHSIRRPLPRTYTVSPDHLPRITNNFTPLTDINPEKPEPLRTSYSVVNSPDWNANQKKRKRNIAEE